MKFIVIIFINLIILISSVNAKYSQNDLIINLEKNIYIGKIKAKLISFGGYNTPECKLAISEDGRYFYLKKINSTCIKLTNKKGIKIICNSNKSVCKTRAELVEFIKNSKYNNTINLNFNRPKWCNSNKLTSIEKIICSDKELSSLDLKLTSLYNSSKIVKDNISQKNWLQNKRDMCGSNKKCLINAYKDRISFLKYKIKNSQTKADQNNIEKPGYIKKTKKGIKKQKKPNSGTGFFVTNEYVITNYHVVKNCPSNIILKKVTFKSNAEVLAVDKYNDLALLQSSKTNPFFLKLKSPPRVKHGENIVIMGYPMGKYLGNKIKLSTGIVSGLTGVNNDTTKFQVTAPIQQGNSGGPVFNDKGEVVGVVYATVTKATNIGLSIKGSILNDFLDSNGIEYTTSNSTTKLETYKIINKADKAIVQVICK